MSTRACSRSIAASVALIALALLLAGCSGDSGDAVDTADTVATTTSPESATTAATGPGATTPISPKTITIVVKNAAPDGGIKRVTVAKDDEVELVVHSDVDDEVHLHGYNLATDVAAGGVGRISFVATLPGRFEAELEQRGVQIAELTVTP